MRNIIENMRNVGASDTTVNIFIIMFMIFVFIIGIGAFVIAGIMLIQGQTPPNWLTGLITALVGAIIVLLTAAHQTSAINGTAAKTAASTVTGLQPTLNQAAQTGIVNAQTLQSVMQAIAAIQQSQSQTIASQAQINAANTLSNSTQQVGIQNTVQENTEATKQNTMAVLETSSSSFDIPSHLKQG